MSKLERLKEIIAHAYENAPAVRKKMEEAGVTPADIQSAADLPKIPVTTKDQLVQMQQEAPPFGGWLAVPKEDLRRIFISPGPIFEPEGKEQSRQWRTEAFEAVGIGPGDIVLNTFAYHLTPAGLIFDYAAAASGASVVPTGPGNTESQVKIMMALQATGYTGTPSFLKIILEKAAEMGVPREAISVKKAIFTAEPYPPSLRAYFEQDYGMVTSQAYATAELGVVAFDWTGQTSLKISRNLIVEIVDLASDQPIPDGGPGQVVVTNFNKTYPLIRLGLGDLSAFVGEPDEEDFYSHMKGWLGRVGDAIKVRGMFLHPLQLKGAIAKFEAIGNIQALVTRPDTRDYIKLRIELKASSINQVALNEEIKVAVSQACHLKIDEVEFIETGSIDPSARTVIDERNWD